MGMYLDPHTGKMRQYGCDGYPVSSSDGPILYNSSADEIRRRREEEEDRRRRQEEDERHNRRPLAVSSDSSPSPQYPQILPPTDERLAAWIRAAPLPPGSQQSDEEIGRVEENRRKGQQLEDVRLKAFLESEECKTQARLYSEFSESSLWCRFWSNKPFSWPTHTYSYYDPWFGDPNRQCHIEIGWWGGTGTWNDRKPLEQWLKGQTGQRA